VAYLNNELRDLNKNKILYLEDRCFILWSGDSDFVDPVEALLNKGKKVYLFATTGRVSSELSQLTSKGLMIYDIRKIKDFICWKKEMIKLS
jgi:hypothetical protein